LSNRYLDLARQALKDRREPGKELPPCPDEEVAGPWHGVAEEPAGVRGRVLVFEPERSDRAIPDKASACPACHGDDFWISLAMVRICERCHPPADERIVARRERKPATLAPVAPSPEVEGPAIPRATRPETPVSGDREGGGRCEDSVTP
jgi:hypothetical protein